MQDIIARSLGAKLNGDVEQINKKIETLSKIFTFKGTKERVEDLPKEGNKPGDMWSVKGREYVWTLNDETGEYEWVDIGDIADLDAFIMKTDIEQTIGDNENKVMSQKAVRDSIENYNKGMYSNITMIQDYLFETVYDNVDYDFAQEYLDGANGDPDDNGKLFGGKFGVGGCSAVRKGNWYGRNFDWTYDESVDFIVKVPRAEGRYASMGISNGGRKLDNTFVKSGKYSDEYRIIPFKVIDGINEKGVIVNSNVVPRDKGQTTEVVPAIEEKERINMLALARFILDRFDTASGAVEYIKNYVAVTTYAPLVGAHYDLHYMVADENNTYIIEFVNNATVIIDVSEGAAGVNGGKSYMTNFFISGMTPNEDGTVYTPATQDGTHDAINTNGITEYGCGLERYNIIAGAFDGIESKNNMKSLMGQLKYTKAYSTSTEVSNPYWYTEFVGGDCKVNSAVSDFSDIVQRSGAAFASRSRDPRSENFGTWQTTHSCVYDIDQRKVYIIVQENGVEREFDFEFYYDAKEVDELIEALDEKKADLDYVNSKGHYLGLWNAINGTCNTGLEVGTEYVPGDEFVIGEASAPKNMIVNGDFSVSSTAVPALFGWDIAAWNRLQSKRIEGGVAYVQNGSDNNKTIKQTVSNLVIGETYWLTAKLPYVKDKAIKILLDDNGAKPITTVPISDEAQTFSIGIVATSTSHTITFSGPNAIYALTDVVLKSEAVPNYRPFGDTYTGVQKVEMESENVEINDSYLYDGTNWRLLKNVGEKIDVDADLNPDSTNPVQNKVVTAAIQGIEEEIDGLTKDLKGEVLNIYFDPTASQSGTGLSSDSPVNSSDGVWELVNQYNGDIVINGSNTSQNNPLYFIGNLSNKNIRFQRIFVFIDEWCHISNVNLKIGYQSTLFRNHSSCKIGCSGNCTIVLGYYGTITDTAASNEYSCMIFGDVPQYPGLPCNIIFIAEEPSWTINSNSDCLINNYGSGNTVCYIAGEGGAGGTIKALCASSVNYSCEINVFKDVSLTKNSWTTDDKYAIINYAGEHKGDPIDLNGAERNIYIDGVSGQDSRDGSSSSKAIKTWARAVEIMNSYSNETRFTINGIGCHTKQTALDIGNSFIEGKQICFSGSSGGSYYSPISGNCTFSNCNIILQLGYPTLYRDSSNGSMIFFNGDCNLYMGYQSEILDDYGTEASNDYYSFIQSKNGKLNVIADYAPNTYITSTGGILFGYSNCEGYIEFFINQTTQINVNRDGTGYLTYACAYNNPIIHIGKGVSTTGMTAWTADMPNTTIIESGALTDMKSAGKYIYIDPVSGYDGRDGSSSSTAIKTWGRALEIMNSVYNESEIHICAPNSSMSNPVNISGSVSNKNITFAYQGVYCPYEGDAIFTNCNITLIAEATLLRHNSKGNQVKFFGSSTLTMNYESTIQDNYGSQENSDRYGFISAEEGADLTVNITNGSDCYLYLEGGFLFSSYNGGTLTFNINSIVKGNLIKKTYYPSYTQGYLALADSGQSPIFNIASDLSQLNKTSLTNNDKYAIINYAGQPTNLKGSSINVYLNSNTGYDNNTGLTSNSAIKTWGRLLEILNGYKNGKVIVNIIGTLDMNITNKNVQLDNVDLEFVGNVTVSMNTYFTNVNITYHNGDWVSSSITYLTNCSFTAYTCTLDDDNLASNQPRFTVTGSRVYLGQDTSWCTLTSTNQYGLFYCSGLSSEFYLQRADGTINYLCDYSGSSSIKYSSVIYVYGDDITKTGYINEGDSNGTIIYRGTYIPLPQVTSADNGKILQVVNGQWTAVDLSMWQGGSY